MQKGNNLSDRAIPINFKILNNKFKYDKKDLTNH